MMSNKVNIMPPVFPLSKYLALNAGYTHLHTFCDEFTENHDLNIINKLVKSGVDINSTDCENCTCLHYACENGSISLVERLLDYGADITRKDIFENTILHYIGEYSNTKLLKYLLLKFNNFDFTAINESYFTILHFACLHNNYEMVKIILDNDSSTINWKTKYGKTASELTDNSKIINLIENYKNSNDENNINKKQKL